jgi:hypothetical protein
VRILVCGGRMYGRIADDCPPDRLNAERERAGRERMLLYRTLRDSGPTLLLHGGASGADHFASNWADFEGVKSQVFPADWAEHGRAAGPIRNQRMLDEGKPDLVIAFPGGRGTADMVRRAKAAGIKVREVAA